MVSQFTNSSISNVSYKQFIEENIENNVNTVFKKSLKLEDISSKSLKSKIILKKGNK